MIRQIAAASLLTLSGILAGCAVTSGDIEPQTPVATLQDAVITGQATYRERIALLPGSVFKVTLLDISRADAAADVLANDTRNLAGEQVPLPFSMAIENHRLKSSMRYAVRATITDPAGRLAWTTDRVYPVDPDLTRQDLGTLELVRVRSSQQAERLPDGERRIEFIAGRPVPDRARVTVAFSAAGRVEGSTGCNSYSGPYSVNGESLRIGPLAVTKRACIPALGDLEQGFLGVMRDVSTWRLDEMGRLVLSAPSGRTVVATAP